MKRVVRSTLVGLLTIAGLSAMMSPTKSGAKPVTPMYASGPPPAVMVQQVSLPAIEKIVIAKKGAEYVDTEKISSAALGGAANVKADAQVSTNFVGSIRLGNPGAAMSTDSALKSANMADNTLNTTRAPDAIETSIAHGAAAFMVTSDTATAGFRNGTQRAGPRHSAQHPTTIADG